LPTNVSESEKMQIVNDEI